MQAQQVGSALLHYLPLIEYNSLHTSELPFYVPLGTQNFLFHK